MVSSGLRGYPFFSDNPKAPSFAKKRIQFTTPRKPLEVRSSHLGMQLFLGHSWETVSKMVLVGHWIIFPVYIQKLSFDGFVVRNYDTTGANFQSRPWQRRSVLVGDYSLGILALLLRKYNH